MPMPGRYSVITLTMAVFYFMLAESATHSASNYPLQVLYALLNGHPWVSHDHF